MTEHERIAAAYNAARPCAEQGEQMPDWKRDERAIALRLGGTRVPVSGRARGETPDIAHALFAVECKTRKALPVLLKDAMLQAKAAVRGDQVPVVVLHQTGQRHADDLVVLRLADFEALYGDVPMGEMQP
jgi:hypothetical protein